MGTKYQLDDAFAAAATCPEGKPYHDYYDEQTTGLHLRVTKPGKKTWQGSQWELSAIG
jgi:hypothetical protein